MQRVRMYVDGFNLFYGLRARGWRRYYWLDLHRLAAPALRHHYLQAAVVARSPLMQLIDCSNAQGVGHTLRGEDKV